MFDHSVLSLVDNLIMTSSDAVHLKDAKSGKYLASNDHNLSIFDLKENDFVNRTIWDINDTMIQYWVDNATQMDAYEEQVRLTGRAVVDNSRVWLNSKGYVWRHTMNKMPVMNLSNNVSAILSIGRDLTRELSLKELYGYYRHFYKNKRIATTKFLEHTGIIQFFNELPTPTELMILITRADFIRNKEVAMHLEYSKSTVESYINQIIQKVKDFDNVLAALRAW